jgi:hypothetical protein
MASDHRANPRSRPLEPLAGVGVARQQRRCGRRRPLPVSDRAEGQRVLYTFLGVGIAVIVMLLLDQLQKRAGKAAPQAP